MNTSQPKPPNQRPHNPHLRQELIDAGLIRPGPEQPPFVPTPVTTYHPAFVDEPPPARKRRRRA